MSVIFKTLKKLRTESADRGEVRRKPVHRKRIYSFKTALNSSFTAILLLSGCLIVGSGTLYGYFQLCGAVGEKVKGAAISNTEIHRSSDGYFDKSMERIGTERLDVAKQTGLSEIKYRPPEVMNRNKKLRASKADNVRRPFVRTKEKPSGDNGLLKKDGVAEIQTETAGNPSSTEILPVPDLEKIFLKNAKKNAKIARLVADIRWEMSQGDKNRIQKLFDELILMKGQNNNYVVKLKAVWHIRNKEYERAADLLKTVLTKNERDIEAGINMAIVEINTKQEENAFRRLEKLQTIYPENIRLAEIMQRLRRLFNKEKTLHFSRRDG